MRQESAQTDTEPFTAAQWRSPRHPLLAWRPVAASQSPLPKRTPLYDRHVRAGARLVDFAGWEMPVQYDGVRQEHLRVREHAGIFDVSHMGQIATSGPEATELLQRLLSNDVAKLAVGGAQYSVLCLPDGGVLDDLFTYRLGPDSYLTVTNASNHLRDVATFLAGADGFDAVVQDVADRYAMLAVQGPAAREIVQASADRPLPARLTTDRRVVHAIDVLVCGTGYTGEAGVELLVAPEDAPALWDELVRRGAAPAGLGARDTLRTEVCFPLYGQELTEERNPIAAGLGWCCKEDTGFVGADAVRAMRASGPPEKLVAFVIEGPGIARSGNPIVGGGVVTSGTLSPSLEVGIGMGYVPTGRAGAGEHLQIDVRGRTREAVIRPAPLVPKRG